ncbi:uncharacterized protein LOC101456425 isoform X2 [Ceratitis capitata]|uniref:uncharacterized protein LOC101456425 isoform X2 n=1 Tax=Ceratitis capitata TaxID=7213 RepID=UPI000329A4B3|nr:uncharacterized protein LOC101456425 isoform X2 [Ceratitis capitata]
MDATSVESIITMLPLGSGTPNKTNNSNSSSSSSSISSGYASATTTPTNPASAGSSSSNSSSSSHSQYSDSHSSTPVGLVEPTPAAATIATVTPYYNETFQQQQLHHHHHQHQQQQANFQQQHQSQHYPPKQPHYQEQPTRSYQLGDEQLGSPAPTQYNSSYDSAYAYTAAAGESYQQASGVERNLLEMRHTTAYYTTPEKPSKQHTQPILHSHSHTASGNNSSNSSSNNNNKAYNSNSNELSLNNLKRIGEPPTTTKPQATATPFYAQALQASDSNASTEAYKYKMSIKLPNHSIDYVNYNQQSLDAGNTVNYSQNFPQHHATKTLSEVAYSTTSPTTQMKPFNTAPNIRGPQQRLGLHYGSTAPPVGVTIGSATSNSLSASNNGSAGTYLDKYDKYLYTAVTTAAHSAYYTSTQPANISAMPYNAVAYATAQPATAPAAIPATHPPQYAAEMPNDPYRKATASSSSWHWSMEYANGNCRTLPPPPPPAPTQAVNGIPTATIPPTNASYVPTNATVAANRDTMYYTAEKYNNKYDKYNSYYNSPHHLQHHPHPHHQHQQQQYMSAAAAAANTSGRGVWPNSPHNSAHMVPALSERLSHPYTHHAPLPPSGVSSAHPNLAYHHHPYPPQSTPAAAARQNCCTQPFQQQNCYYTRTPHHPHFLPNTYNPHVQASPYGSTGLVGSGSNSSNVGLKYGLLEYGHAAKSKVNTNDVYATTPTYEASNMNYHTYPAGVAHNQQYSNVVTPAAVMAHQPLNHNITTGQHNDLPTAYYNDLNMQTCYDNYMSPLQATPLVQQRRESLVQRVDHLTNLPSSYVQNTAAKNSLIDYRKSAVATSDDCIIGEPTLTNLDEHMAINMSHYENSYRLGGELRPLDVSMYAKSTSTVEPAEKSGMPTTPTTKTYSSLRDFLSTWNEDEEDYGGGDELSFVESGQQVVEQTISALDHTNNRVEVKQDMPCLQELPEINAPASYVVGEPPELPLAENLTSFPALKNVDTAAAVGGETNQYANINLPDIIIDIEKSNGSQGGNTKPNTTDATQKSDIKPVNYDCFDVEKELDELETKKIKRSKMTTETPPIRSGSVIVKPEAEVLEIATGTMHERLMPSVKDDLQSLKPFESLDSISACVEPLEKMEADFISTEHKADITSSTVQAKTDHIFDRNMESDSTTSSNGSTFEKEYETFINKIGNDFDYTAVGAGNSDSSVNTSQISDKLSTAKNASTLNTTPLKESAVSDLEIAHKIKSFSKFYKRKRKDSDSKKDNAKIPKISQEQQQQQVLVDKESTFPITSNKHLKSIKFSRANRLKSMRTQKLNSRSYYRRTLRSLRRRHIITAQRLDFTAVISQDIARVVESSLPLIKRKSITLYSSRDENETKQNYNPPTLKSLSIDFINSALFQEQLVQAAEIDKQSEVMSVCMTTNVENNFEMTNQTPLENETMTVGKKIICLDAFEPSDINDILDVVENGLSEQLLETQQLDEVEIEKQTENLYSLENNLEVCVDSDEPKTETTHLDTINVEDSALLVSDNTENKVANNDAVEEMAEVQVENKCIQGSIYSAAKNDNGNQEIEAETANVANIPADFDEKFDKSMENVESAVEDKVKETKQIEDVKSLPKDLMASTTQSEVIECPMSDLTAENVENLGNITTVESSEVTEHEEKPTQNGDSNANLVEEQTTAATSSINSVLDKETVQEIEVKPEETYKKSDEIEEETNEIEKESKTSNAPLVSVAADENKAILQHIQIGRSPLQMVVDIDTPQQDDPNETSSQQLHFNSELDLSEMENSLDMFGARKSAEYFTTTSKNYFEKPTDIDENSTDSSSSSSTDSSSSTASEGRSASSSSTSSSSSSDDEDSRSSTSTVQSDFNEMKELERELSQHQTNEFSHLNKDEFEEKTVMHTYNEHDDGVQKVCIVGADKTIKENDIKTLKKILESDSDGLEEISTNLKEIKSNSLMEENVHAVEEIASVLKHKNANEGNVTREDKISMVDDESVELNGESKLFVAARGCEGEAEGVQTDYAATSGAEDCVKLCDVENGASELQTEENQNEVNQKEDETTLNCAATSAALHAYEVPSLKQIVLIYLEREKCNEDHEMINRTEDALNSKIPKLSDLCKIALSSSFEINTTNNNTNQNTPEPLERELSVEEALAEMYRQAGVTSDPEDGDADEKEAQQEDVVLINLEEILVNDSDLYVLQCDMNENVLSVVAHAQPMPMEESIENIERELNSEILEDAMILDNTPKVLLMTNETLNENNFNETFMSLHEEEKGEEKELRVESSGLEALNAYITPTHTLDYVDDDLRITNDDSLNNTQYDFPAIHHEEIVAHDYRRHRRQDPTW